MPRQWLGKVFIAVSVDGFIARSDGGLDWLTEPRVDAGKAAQTPKGQRTVADYATHLAGVDALVMGRSTYETVRSFDEWPYPHLPVIVISTTITAGLDERITVVRSITQAVAQLDHISATGAYLDGGRVIQSFLRAGLVSDLVLTRVPVLLGSGLPLFGHLDEDIHLDHLGTDVIEHGMVSTHYRVVAGDSGENKESEMRFLS